MYKVLIVDDEQMIRMGIKEGLDWKKLGIGEVYTASDIKIEEDSRMGKLFRCIFLCINS